MGTAGSHLRAVCLHLLVLAAVCGHAGPAWTQGQPTAAPDPAAGPVAIAPEKDHLLAGSTLVGGSYVLMGAYAYASWYQTEDPVGFFVTDDSWFGQDTYAGGADKLGHFFANYVITRTGHDVLTWAGLSRNTALTTSFVLDALFFTAIEIKDGKTKGLGFSWGDIAANLSGNMLAAALVLNPSLDRALDFRLEYYPSQEYLDAVQESGTVNAVEDYTGMTFGLWYHLSELPGIRKQPLLSWIRFIDIGVTYGTRYYLPEPYEYREPRRELSVALTLNVAAVVRALSGGRAPLLVGASDWVFEYFTIPGTTLEVR